MRKKLFIFLSIIFAAVLLVSCKNKPVDPSTEPTGSTTVISETEPTKVESTIPIVTTKPTETTEPTEPVEPTTEVPSEEPTVSKPTPTPEPTPIVYFYVSFSDEEGQTLIEPVEVEENKKVSKPEDPIKSGFIFDNWYLDDVIYDFDLAVTKDLALVAKFEEITVEISGEVIGAQGEEILLELLVTPEAALELDINWTSSDDSIASVKDGLVSLHNLGVVVITATIDGITDTIEITVVEPVISTDTIEISGKDKWLVGETINLFGDVVPANATNKEFIWESDDETIATIDAFGVVTLLAEGEVNIKAIQDDVVSTYKVTAMEEFDYVYDYFLTHMRSSVDMQTIAYFGSKQTLHDLYPSVHPYSFGDEAEIERVMVPKEKPNHSNRIMPSLEWIVVHDVGSDGSASAHAHAQATNPDAQVSWHYTVGPDGWFQSLEHEDVGWHAGDGSQTAGFTDTGIPARQLKPEMTIDEEGYYVFLNQRTDVKAPLKNGMIPTNADIVRAGIWPVVINGTYHVPKTFYTTQNGGGVAFAGGNYNGIGIETSVQPGTDVWVTWHRTAKLVAKLLVENDMLPDRITFHNHFMAKNCPQTAMRSDNWDNWIDLMEFEYTVLKYFSDYEFELIADNEALISPTGRVLGVHPDRTFTRFIIKITNSEGEVKTTPKQRIIFNNK